MKKVKSQILINTLEERVEKHLQVAIEKYQNLEEDTLLKSASDGGWSMAQCLDHLNGYGDFYLPEIKKGLAKKFQPKEYFKSSWLGSYFTRMMEPETGKKKMRAFKNHVPSTELNPHTVVAEFIRQQEELLNLLSKARNADLNKIKIPISISKLVKLKLGDVFQFLIAHNERHIQQAERVYKNVDVLIK
ncbi:MAG: DinB family protein [Candidatus Cyclobacteriaceae bacterium M2_1C_046]